MSVYWAVSRWDLNVLLEDEASIETLRSVVQQNPTAAGIRLVKYSLAVRLAREDRYEESAEIYDAIHAVRRGPRMRRLAASSRNRLQAYPGGGNWGPGRPCLRSGASRGISERFGREEEIRRADIVMGVVAAVIKPLRCGDRDSRV